jgi:hypothetical protein
LMVLFGCDGIIYHRGSQMTQPTLFSDPLYAEGEFFKRHRGQLPGVAEAFVAGFAKALVIGQNYNIEESVVSGLRVTRMLALRGLSLSKGSSCSFVFDCAVPITGQRGNRGDSGDNVDSGEISDRDDGGEIGDRNNEGGIWGGGNGSNGVDGYKDDDDTGNWIRFSIPSNDICKSSRRDWSLLDRTIGDSADIARRIVRSRVLSLTKRY